MQIINQTSIRFDYNLKLLILKLRHEHSSLIHCLTSFNHDVLQDAQIEIRDYFFKHQNELNIAGRLTKTYESCSDYFALLCANVCDLSKCESWDDVFEQFRFTEISFCNFGDDPSMNSLICMCSHFCKPFNMSIFCNKHTNYNALIACDCLTKTGIMNKNEFKKKSKKNESYAKLMYKFEVEKNKKKSSVEKWESMVKKYVDAKENYRCCSKCGVRNIHESQGNYVTMCKPCYSDSISTLQKGTCYLRIKPRL